LNDFLFIAEMNLPTFSDDGNKFSAMGTPASGTARICL